jgi:hypothetical protein
MYDVQKVLRVSDKTSRELLKENLRLAGKPKLDGFEAHHYLPLEFEEFFVKARLDPNDAEFGEWIPTALHRKWHGSDPANGLYNPVWRQFFREYQTATSMQIRQKLTDLRAGKFKL